MGRFTLPRAQILKRPGDIREVFHRGRKKTGRYVNLFTLKSDDSRFAVIIPRRIGNAVRRNRMKRLCREIYRLHPQWFEESRTLIFVKKFHDVYGDLVEDIAQLVNES